MQYQNLEDGFLILFEKDEPLMSGLSEFMQKHQIAGGFIQGLGALKDVRLGFYHLHQKTYQERTLKGDFELVSLIGNASWCDGKPIIHCHAGLGDEEFRLHGGHLFEGHVAVVTEVYLRTTATKVNRKFSDSM